ncbi:MAG TPA: hypothetical protein VFV30_12620 [Novosphingobium sp.]|nr:hypothetical protein [Novosphingobium sp.]
MTVKELGWPAIGAMLCALATAAILVSGQFALILGMFPVQLLGLTLLAVAVWQTRRWWLLVFALPMILPLGMWLTLFYQCARGICL